MATIAKHPDTPSYEDKDILSADVLPVSEQGEGLVDADIAAARQLFTYQDGERLKRKADWRLLTFLALAYLLKNMDQNLASYLLTINTDKDTNILKMLNMTKDDYSFVSTFFAIFFLLAEIPSNLTIKWATPRIHFSRIIILWSIVCACHAACNNKASLYACRALLGLFEGGLWPGICYQLTCWYRPDELAVRATALITFSGVLDAVLTYAISFIDGKGMAGWQWCFVIFGCFGFVLGIAIYFFLPDWPDSPPSRRQFLTPEEGAFMTARMPPNASKSSDENIEWNVIKRDLRGGLVWSFGCLMMFSSIGMTGLTFWMPTIVQSFGIAGREKSTLLTIAPSSLYIITSVTFGYFFDRTTRFARPIYMYIAQIVAIGCFIGLTLCRNTTGLFVLIMLTYVCWAVFQTCIIPLRAMSTTGSTSAAFAYAFQNFLGNMPLLFSAQIFRAQYAPYYTIPFIICIIFILASLVAVSTMWWCCYDLERETRMVAGERRRAGKTGEVVAIDVQGGVKKY